MWQESQEAGVVSSQMLPRGRVKKGRTDKGAPDFATRRPGVTSRRSVSMAEPEGGGLRSEWEVRKQRLHQ